MHLIFLKSTWHRLVVSFHVVVFGFALVSCTSASPGPNKSATWSRITIHSKVYTAGNGTLAGDVQAICPTVQALLYSDNTGRLGACVGAKRGTPATVVKVFARKQNDPSEPYGIVELRAIDGSWRGFTRVDELQPDIPIGTVLKMADPEGSPLYLDPDLKGSHRGPDIGHATVKVLRLDPRWEDYMLYVRVLDGSFKGRTGWLPVQTAVGAGLGIYGVSNE